MPVEDDVVAEGARVRKANTVSLATALGLAADPQEAGDLDEAASLYERILARLPHQPQALTMRASVAYRQGDEEAGDRHIDRAIDVLALALDDMPPDAPEQAGLANLLLARNRFDEAAARLAHVELPLKPVRSCAADFDARRKRA